MDVYLMYIQNNIHQGYKALEKDYLSLAEFLLSKASDYLLTLPKNSDSLQIAGMLGGVLIDLGSDLLSIGETEKAKYFFEQGILFSTEVVACLPNYPYMERVFYNIANGYNELHRLETKESSQRNILSENFLREKEYYAAAIAICKQKGFDNIEKSFLCELYVNFGNCLDSIWRNIEALEYYEKALAINPDMGNALGNKAVTIHRLAFSVQGSTHIFILEAKNLLERALDQTLPKGASVVYQRKLDEINRIINLHPKPFEPEEIEQPTSAVDFHKYLREFSLANKLVLAPTTLLGTEDGQYCKDSLFPRSFSCAHDSREIERNINFINQIKQDYFSSRYLLAKSQYRSNELDSIDDDVDLFYPLDYTIYSSYAQMMKISFRLSVDIFDKIANFVRDYFSLTDPPIKNTYFRNLWFAKLHPNELREQIKNKGNRFSLTFLSLAIDINSSEEYQFIQERRNALTHRFLSLFSEFEEKSNQLPDFVQIDEFYEECLKTLQLARSAIVYLIQLIDYEESQKEKPESYLEFPLTKLDDDLRWKPTHGEN